MVYVDTAPGKPPLDPDFAEVEKPLDWEEIEQGENLDGLTDEQKATFRARAVPVPAAAIRGTYTFTNDARRHIPSTIIATGYSAEDYRSYAAAHPDWAFLAGIPELTDITWVDVPTSHWPMWSKPGEIARIIGDISVRAGASGASPSAVADYGRDRLTGRVVID
jgi:hypothetical protein